MSSYKDMLAKTAKEWDCPDLMNAANEKIERIPFSSPLLNYATYGGVPRNRVIEFYGNPGSGKTTTAIDIASNAVRLFKNEFEAKLDSYRVKLSGGDKSYAGLIDDLVEQGPQRVLYVDIEHSYDFRWAIKMNIQEGDIDVMQPPNIPAEKILQKVEDIICTGGVGLVVLDSIPTLVTESELNKKYGERTVASLAGLMTVFLRKIVPILTMHGCTLILINQVRDNMDNPYVVNTPGGQAVKFYSSLRMLFKLGAPVDFVGNELPASTEDPAGYLVNVKLTKNKAGAFDRKNASYFLMMKSGIRPDFDFAKLAINKFGIIKKGGAWFSMCDPNTGEILEDADGKPIKVNGLVRVYDYLNSNSEYYELVKNYILDHIDGEEPKND